MNTRNAPSASEMEDDAWWGCQLMLFKAATLFVYRISIASLSPSSKKIYIRVHRSMKRVNWTYRKDFTLTWHSRSAIKRIEFVLYASEKLASHGLLNFILDAKYMHAVCVVCIQMRERASFVCSSRAPREIFSKTRPSEWISPEVSHVRNILLRNRHRAWFYITVHILCCIP